MWWSQGLKNRSVLGDTTDLYWFEQWPVYKPLVCRNKAWAKPACEQLTAKEEVACELPLRRRKLPSITEGSVEEEEAAHSQSASFCQGGESYLWFCFLLSLQFRPVSPPFSSTSFFLLMPRRRKLWCASFCRGASCSLTACKLLPRRRKLLTVSLPLFFTTSVPSNIYRAEYRSIF